MEMIKYNIKILQYINKNPMQIEQQKSQLTRFLDSFNKDSSKVKFQLNDQTKQQHNTLIQIALLFINQLTQNKQNKYSCSEFNLKIGSLLEILGNRSNMQQPAKFFMNFDHVSICLLSQSKSQQQMELFVSFAGIYPRIAITKQLSSGIPKFIPQIFTIDGDSEYYIGNRNWVLSRNSLLLKFRSQQIKALKQENKKIYLSYAILLGNQQDILENINSDWVHVTWAKLYCCYLYYNLNNLKRVILNDSNSDIPPYQLIQDHPYNYEDIDLIKIRQSIEIESDSMDELSYLLIGQLLKQEQYDFSVIQQKIGKLKAKSEDHQTILILSTILYQFSKSQFLKNIIKQLSILLKSQQLFFPIIYQNEQEFLNELSDNLTDLKKIKLLSPKMQKKMAIKYREYHQNHILYLIEYFQGQKTKQNLNLLQFIYEGFQYFELKELNNSIRYLEQNKMKYKELLKQESKKKQYDEIIVYWRYLYEIFNNNKINKDNNDKLLKIIKEEKSFRQFQKLKKVTVCRKWVLRFFISICDFVNYCIQNGQNAKQQAITEAINYFRSIGQLEDVMTIDDYDNEILPRLMTILANDIQTVRNIFGVKDY